MGAYVSDNLSPSLAQFYMLEIIYDDMSSQFLSLH